MAGRNSDGEQSLVIDKFWPVLRGLSSLPEKATTRSSSHCFLEKEQLPSNLIWKSDSQRQNPAPSAARKEQRDTEIVDKLGNKAFITTNGCIEVHLRSRFTLHESIPGNAVCPPFQKIHRTLHRNRPARPPIPSSQNANLDLAAPVHPSASRHHSRDLAVSSGSRRASTPRSSWADPSHSARARVRSYRCAFRLCGRPLAR